MHIKFGNQRIIGQKRAKEQVERILSSNRLGHAYLISGPSGVGKTAFALALAEAINGIDNLSELGSYTTSKKSSWFTHPDIHVFIPRPTTSKIEELRDRLELLSNDPYEIIGFPERPSLSEESSKNKQAFYFADYFKRDIRPVAKLKPNEGSRVVVIITQIENMRKEAANAFLKLLEEPSERLMFILTTEAYERLLPTITSRCQHIPLGTLKNEEVEQGLIDLDGVQPEDAAYLARISNGNYAMTRFYDIEKLKENREAVVDYLRMAFSQDAVGLSKLVQDWQSSNNIEGLLSLTNLIEMYIHDLMIYRETENKEFVTNIDQLDSIQKFVKALDKARLEEMIVHLDECRPAIRRNVNVKLMFIVLALRFSTLMRGLEPSIPESESWKHIPAFME
jgi:DNA polymerase-3 subunit delta'